MNKFIFLVEDDDTGEHYAFYGRYHAIDFMFRKCKEWKAILLYFSVDDLTGKEAITSFDCSTMPENDVKVYLYSLSDSKLNQTLECYFYFEKIKISDYFD